MLSSMPMVIAINMMMLTKTATIMIFMMFMMTMRVMMIFSDIIKFTISIMIHLLA